MPDTILAMINKILHAHNWWHQQLAGCCAGVVINGIKVPIGVAHMAHLMAKYSGKEAAAITLLRYQSVAEESLLRRGCMSFFKAREKVTTNGFYYLLDKLNIKCIGREDWQSFNDFLKLVAMTDDPCISQYVSASSHKS